MKIFVKDPDTNNKIYLNKTASCRNELAQQLGNLNFMVNGKLFSVGDTFAEKSSDSTALGLVIGGALGLIGGTLGVLLGGAIGGTLGNDTDNKETKQVEIFNRSII